MREHKVFFTADTHFSHKNIIRYCDRPFDSSEEMNATMISNWNAVVRKHDTVYHMGDFCFGNPEPIIQQLHGHIILVRGNHDKQITGEMEKLFLAIYDRKFIKIQGQYTVLDHWAGRVWDKSHHNSYQLYGHSHGRLPPVGKQWDVGVDNNNFTPLSEKDIIRIMKSRPDNEGYINKEKRYHER